MRILGAVIQLFPLMIFFKKKKKDILCPENIITFLYIIRIMIPTIMYAFESNIELISYPYLKEAVSSDTIYISYSIIQVIGFFLTILGTKIVGKRHNNNKEVLYVNELLSKNNINRINFKRWGIIFWGIGFCAFILIMKKVGGFYYFITHLNYRTFMTRNLDILTLILSFMHYGILLIVYSLKDNNKKISVGLIFFSIITGLMCGLGGRKTVLLVLIEVFVIYNYTVKPISFNFFLKGKYVILFFSMWLLFFVMVSFRVPGAFEEFLEQPIRFLEANNIGILDMIRKESYVPFYMAVIYYFKNHNLWFGASFKGLLTAIIPSSLYPEKAPVDDGMYLYSICLGKNNIRPIMPVYELDGSSLPLETFGSMYANFGVIGVLIGMLIVGCVIGYFYRKIRKTNERLFYLVMYTQVLVGFELSTLRIFQIFQIMIILYLVELMGRKMEIISSKKG
ncbi:O-antigen polymerase [Clostridium perfringens]|uniref:O-antigen polymerase n=1 Tax=Clostridium perfringens TaxID=1502 RepID=UPI0018E435CF|nr:O-antigen polymerase [Clostridium perfringens]MBI5995331.1 O-antigen polysaccharide polymerase Wzy [Clostridium perfringens]